MLCCQVDFLADAILEKNLFSRDNSRKEWI
jgi:hypothetical protein